MTRLKDGKEEQEPEAMPFYRDTKDGIFCTCLPQIGSAMTPAPSGALRQEEEPFPDTGKKKGEENKYEKR